MSSFSPKMNSPAHQACDFMVNFGAENGNFWHISLLWHVAQIRGSMLKKIAQIRDTKGNQARYWSVRAPSGLCLGSHTPWTARGDVPRDVTSEAKNPNLRPFRLNYLVSDIPVWVLRSSHKKVYGLVRSTSKSGLERSKWSKVMIFPVQASFDPCLSGCGNLKF